VHIVLLSTENIKGVLGVIQWVRTEEANKEFAILASSPVTIPFTPKLYRKGSDFARVITLPSARQNTGLKFVKSHILIYYR
jgi:hypothetical protein